MLTKTVATLQLAGHDETGASFEFDHEGEYVAALDRTVRMSCQFWDDMGRPDTITVTIEPGDTLNA